MKKLLFIYLLLLQTALAGFSIYDSGFPIQALKPYPGKVLVKASSALVIGIPWQSNIPSAMHIDSTKTAFLAYWEDSPEEYDFGLSRAKLSGFSQGKLWFTIPKLAKGCYTATLATLKAQKIYTRTYPFCI